MAQKENGECWTYGDDAISFGLLCTRMSLPISAYIEHISNQHHALQDICLKKSTLDFQIGNQCMQVLKLFTTHLANGNEVLHSLLITIPALRHVV